MTNQVLYSDEFFDVRDDGSMASARVIVPLLTQSLALNRVLDVGCGRGAWLRVFKENGVEVVHGVDGSYIDRNRLLIDPRCFSPINLVEVPVLPGGFDLCVCLEVAEHLPNRVSRAFVRALTRAAPLVLFSAAVPGQKGYHHVNEQWPCYWRELFAQRGYERLDPIRRHIWHDSRVEFWYRQNVFLYAAVEAIADSDFLRTELTIAKDADFDVIHSKILRRHIRRHSSPRFLLRKLIQITVQRLISARVNNETVDDG
jgi:SAM-dependent methyltransferase